MSLHPRIRALAFAALLGSLIFGASRVAKHQAHELDAESEAFAIGALQEREGSTTITSRLYALELKAGERATFELCFDDALDPARWEGAFSVLVWGEGTQTLGLNIPLDAAHLALARRSPSYSCLPLGSGEIPEDDRYLIDLYHPAEAPIPSALHDVRVAARVLVRLSIQPLDALAFFLCLFAGAAFIFFLPSGGLREGGKAARTEPRLDRRAALLSLASIAFGLALIYAIFSIPRYSALEVMGKSLLMIAAQIAIPLTIARAAQLRPSALIALIAPAGRLSSRALGYALPIASGILLSLFARQLLHWIPATGEAPITSFIAAPSGALAFALIGLLSPLAEEIFFRGFVYGALERYGRALAIVGSAGLFAALHYLQTAGSPGAFLAIAAAGCFFTALRALTGSVYASILAHFAYNAALALTAFI